MKRLRSVLYVVVAIETYLLTAAVAAAPPAAAKGGQASLAETAFKAAAKGQDYAPDSILIKPQKGAPAAAVAGLHAAKRAKVLRTFEHVGGIQSIAVPAGTDPKALVAEYKKSQLVELADLNYRRHVLTTPNDTYLGDQWALHNTGQSGGTADADIDGPEGWDLLRHARWSGGDPAVAHDVVVAVIDTGTDYDHPDLAENMWTNPGEIPGNSIDDDSNGYVDDVHGMSMLNGDKSGDPMDDNGHGTHTAGTIGAAGNNGAGVVGVCWTVKIMACKFLDSGGWGYDADAIDCINYAVANGAHLMSNSWGGGGFDSALEEAIADAGDAGLLFVAAAGNNGRNTDTEANYPSCYNLANIVSVGASDHNDDRALRPGWSSNYGLTTVDLFAPGVNVLSTVPYGQYAAYSGTSMATPHVAGVCALLKAAHPTESYSQLKQRLLAAVDPVPALSGLCSTGGRLNLQRALALPTTAGFRLGPEVLQLEELVGFASGTSRSAYVRNLGGSVITWTASKTANWLDITSGGTVQGEQVTPLTATLNGNADALAVGSYSDTITVSYNIQGGTSGVAEIRIVLLIDPVSPVGGCPEPTSDPIIYVNRSAPGPVHDGTSWANAFTSVASAIDAANEDQEIWVAAGTYYELIEPKDGIRLFGGFAGTEQLREERNWVANQTILDGRSNGPVVKIWARASTATRVDGFTIRNGAGDTLGGGGILCWQSSPVIANNRIVGNSAAWDGGGIMMVGAGSPLIINNIISGNSAGYIEQGLAGGYGRGGAILAADGCTPVIVNNTIVANEATYQAGGIYVTTWSAAVIKNCIVAYNSSGIQTDSGGKVNLGSNDVFGNEGLDYVGFLNPTGSRGNISQDPLLVDYLRGDMHIQPTSPCKDAGDNGPLQSCWLDMDGQVRAQPTGGAVDIGADESDGTEWTAAAIIHVTPEGNDNNDGSTWALAKRTVVAGATKAALQGGEVWVKAGTYVGSTAISAPAFVHLYGGFAGAETSREQRDPAANVTILEGSTNPRVDRTVVRLNSGYRVSTLSGFTIRNGVGGGDSGGGVDVRSSCTISDNIITANTASEGAGICIRGHAARVFNNVITGNTAGQYAHGGGGIYCTGGYPEIHHNTISGNSGLHGGGISSYLAYPKINHNTFNGDSAGPTMESTGGGIYCLYGQPIITHNTFSSCGAELGGGIACVSSGAVIVNNFLYGGSCGSNGAGIYCFGSGPWITNNTIVSNDGVGGWGAMACLSNSAPMISNNIFAFNTSGLMADATSAPVLRNNCVYQNNTDYFGLEPGTGDISADPLLVSWDDVHISAGSPCREAGWNDAPGLPDTDIDDQPRINGVVDIGADEFWP